MGILFWRGRVSKAEFRRDYIATLRQRFPRVDCVEDDADGELSLRISGLPSHDTITQRLDNAYAEFKAKPKNRSEIVGRWLGNLAELLEPRKFERDRVMPFLKSRDFKMDDPPAGKPLPGSRTALFHDVLNDELVVYYVHSGDHNFHFLTREEIAELGLGDEEARALAQRNLRARTPERGFVDFPVGWAVHVGGNFEATMLVDELIWDDERFKSQEWVFAAAPDRNTLLTSVDSSVWGVWTLSFMAATLCRSESYPISPKLFVRREGRFELLDPAIEDPEHPIPRLDVIDVVVETDAGQFCGIVIASPLAADPRSVHRFFRKLDAYLVHLGCNGTPAKLAVAEKDRPLITIRIHPDSHPEVLEMVHSLGDWVAKQGARLEFRSPE